MDTAPLLRRAHGPVGRDVNGEPTMAQETYWRDARPADDGILRFNVIAGTAPDCTVVVVFTDRDPDDELRLDAGQRPANPFGVGQASWQ